MQQKYRNWSGMDSFFFVFVTDTLSCTKKNIICIGENNKGKALRKEGTNNITDAHS